MPKIPEYKLLANELRRDLTGFFSSLGLEKARIERLGKKYGYVFQLATSDDYCDYTLVKSLKSSKTLIKINLVCDHTGKIINVLLKSIQEMNL